MNKNKLLKIIIPAFIIISLESSSENTCSKALVEKDIWLTLVSIQVLLDLRIVVLFGKDCPFLLGER